MALINKPDVSKIWAVSGDVLTPSDTKISTGWQVEIPPRQWFNWHMNRGDQFNAHINQHGFPVWDNTTEYQADISYTKGTTNGTVYRCVQTHTGQDPELDVTNTYWNIAFASAGDFYTKTEADGLYLAKSQNLADLTNTATARTNLSVYSQAQTYTKTEVDGKTTIASALQSQSMASNTVLITPLQLANSFGGANRSITSNGFQRFGTGGIMMIWGTASVTTGTVVNFPIAFPNGVLSMVIGDVTSPGSPNASAVSYHSLSATGFTFVTGSGSADACTYIAIGY